MNNNYQFLVLSDTNDLIDYLFASNKYKTIRGASMILDELNKVHTPELVRMHEGRLISADGGEVKALFGDEQNAQLFIQSLEKKYYEETNAVTLTAACIKRDNLSMKKALDYGESKLREEELNYGKKQMPPLLEFPMIEKCAWCASEAAEHWYSENNQSYEAICRTCYLKIQKTNEVKKNLNTKAVDYIEKNSVFEIHKRLVNSDQKQGQHKWVKKISNLLESDEQSQSNSNYIGFVYADGKQVGTYFRKNVIEELSSDDDEQFIVEYQRVSEELSECLMEAVVETAEETGQLVDYAMLGGDDFVAIMSADYALDYTPRIIEKFEEKTEDRLERRIHMGAGIVIAQKTFPINKLFSNSYSLMEKTKALHQSSSIDFHVIKNMSYLDIIAMRELDHYTLDGRTKLTDREVRTGGFVLGEPEAEEVSYKTLYNTAKALKSQQFPRSKIKDVYHILRESNLELVNYEWQLWMTRLEKPHRNAMFSWNNRLGNTPFSLNSKAGAKPKSPLLDLFDLYEFIGVD